MGRHNCGTEGIVVKNTWPAALRNAEPITAVLKRVLDARSSVLEIASGTGQHAAHFVSALPDIQWQPTDFDSASLTSIEEWRRETGADNFKPPLQLDVCDSEWAIESADAVFCANMIHIAPWECCVGLMRGAGRVLASEGVLLLYGPFFVSGTAAASGNTAFDASLRSRNPDWGIRELSAVQSAALACGLELDEQISMPANNLTLVFKRK